MKCGFGGVGRWSGIALVAGVGAGALPTAHAAPRDPAPRSRVPVPRVGRLEAVHRFYGAMPTGVTVSRSGRIFVNYPRWGDPVRFTVAELRNGQEVPYPNAAMQPTSGTYDPKRLVSVQSVVVDPSDRLWILDTGSIKFGPTQPGGPKLVGVDLRTNRVVRTITFPRDVALPTSYLNDVRFDLRRDQAGMAFITDSSGSGPNAIVVVDLASGRSWRALNDHPSVRPVRGFTPTVEGQFLKNRHPNGAVKAVQIGADGIAISPNGERLYYCPLSSRRLYSVAVDALADPDMSDAEVARTVRDHGAKGASDGLESDARGRVYCTDYEKNGVKVRETDGTYRWLVRDQRLLWPDTLSVAANGYLYITANQLHRQPGYHFGRDQRVKPYMLFRARLR